MKQFLLVIFFLLPVIAFSQITITQSDMPSVGEEFINTNAVLDLTIDPTQTGANYTWDYSDVVPMTTAGDTFVSVPLTYILYFWSSNLAQKTGSFSFGGFGLENVYTFYKKSSSSFENDGYGGLLNGFPLGFVYDTKDILYRFPLNFGDADSSDASLSYSFPGLFYYSQERHRVNEVDGWGSITTPIGTFNALRVKSTITDVDSFYLDTLGFGTGLTLKSYEYKWLAQGKGIPVFQLNAQDVYGATVLSQIIYQDTTFHTGVSEVNESSAINIFPNPSADVVLFSFPNKQKQTVFIYDVVGRLKGKFTATNSSFSIDVSKWQNGMYFVHTTDEKNLFSSSFIVSH